MSKRDDIERDRAACWRRFADAVDAHKRGDKRVCIAYRDAIARAHGEAAGERAEREVVACSKHKPRDAEANRRWRQAFVDLGRVVVEEAPRRDAVHLPPERPAEPRGDCDRAPDQLF